MQENSYEIILLDIDISGSKGLAMFEELKQKSPRTYIIIFSSCNEREALKYISNGADGYINKLYPEEEIIFAINSVLENGFYYSQKLVKMALSLSKKVELSKKVDDILSTRELEIFNLFLSGNNNQQISTLLGLQLSTASTIKKRILHKLGLPNLIELVKRYHNNNLK